MREMNIDPVALVDFIDYMFKDADCSEGVGFIKLVEMTIKLGGANVATVKDVIDMRQVLVQHLDQICASLDKLEGEIVKPMTSPVYGSSLNNASGVDPPRPLLHQVVLDHARNCHPFLHND